MVGAFGSHFAGQDRRNREEHGRRPYLDGLVAQVALTNGVRAVLSLTGNEGGRRLTTLAVHGGKNHSQIWGD